MQQTKKSQISKEKILRAAIVEFGSKSYQNASLNIICGENNISKGLIYHHFKNKDELYISCVKACFDSITAFLENEEYSSLDFKQNVNTVLERRCKFFEENPLYNNIFFNAVLMPPSHLTGQIKEAKQSFVNFNLKFYNHVLESMPLRKGVTKTEAVNYFIMFQEMFNGYFGVEMGNGKDFDTLVKAHESNHRRAIDFMLYGIAKEG